MTRYFEDLLRDSALGSAVKDGAMQECIGGASASQQPKFAERRQLNISTCCRALNGLLSLVISEVVICVEA